MIKLEYPYMDRMRLLVIPCGYDDFQFEIALVFMKTL